MSLLPLVIDYYEPWQCRHGRRQPELDILGELDMFPSIPDILSLAPRRNELRRVAAPNGRDLPTPIVGKDGFKVLMDVKQFKPEEVVVKTVDNHIVVEGKHDEREDEHGHIYRHFTRKYILPKGYDAKEVTSTLSSDGVLTIKAPPPPKKQIEGNERVIEIQQVGPARGGTNGETEKEQEPMQVENGK